MGYKTFFYSIKKIDDSKVSYPPSHGFCPPIHIHIYRITQIQSSVMNWANLKKNELLEICQELGIQKFKSKTKSQLMELLLASSMANSVASHVTTPYTSATPPASIDSISTPFQFIDLFCGIGGFHQALRNLGGECVFASDIDENCRKIYQKNYGILPHGDITKINVDEIPSFDVLCGGFPCQPFSKAGFQRGFDDERGHLFFRICHIVEKHRPKYILLENVRNLASHDEGNTWKVIYDSITKLGYETYKMPVILNTLYFNVPQNRERVIIMCKRKDLGPLPPLPPFPTNNKSMLSKTIQDILCDSSETNKYKIQDKLKEVETVWNEFIQILSCHQIDMPKYPIWTDWWDNVLDETDAFYQKYKSWIDKNRAFYQEHQAVLSEWLHRSRNRTYWLGAVRKFEWQAGDLKSDDSMNTVLWSCRGSGVRVKRCDYVPTLVAMSMTPIYGPESRRLSPRELLRLQSFPDDFQYDEKTIYKQVGNSVNVQMMERCADFLLFQHNLL